MNAWLKRILFLQVFGKKSMQADESLSKLEKDYEKIYIDSDF